MKDCPRDVHVLKLFCCFQLSEEIVAIKKELKKSTGSVQLAELKCRKRVLRRYDLSNGMMQKTLSVPTTRTYLFFLSYLRLNYCTSEDVVTLKGKVACEISTGDELVLTEMIFYNVFTELDGASRVGNLSFCCSSRLVLFSFFFSHSLSPLLFSFPFGIMD